MSFLFSRSRIMPPRFPHILHRTRLTKILEQHQDKKLILILGAAAQGKSTLAVSWINTSKTPWAWINLGAEDADPVSLFYLLLQALEQALPTIDFSVLLGYPSVAMGPREEIPLYRDWARSLYNLLAAPVQLILDGLDQVLAESPAFRFLQVLLDEAPPGLHFILLSREMPSLNLQALRMRQEVFFLTGEELAFTLEEIKEFLKVRRLRLPALTVKQIHRLTEGWAGGLVLLCEGLERLPETSREKYLAGDIIEKFKGDVFRYFAEQIFASLPQVTQEFLINSIILDVVDPDFIKDFLGVEQAREILDDLAKRNLFIQPIYEKERGWLYRYHLLFREFLCAKFKNLMGEERQRAAYLRAGELSEQRDQRHEAVKYYLLAQAYPQAIVAIQKVGLDLLKLGRNAELSSWVQAIPPNLIEEDPWLLFFGYMTRRFSGSPEDIFGLLKARSLFEQRQDERGAILSLAYLAEAAVTRGHPAIPPLCELLDQAETLLQSLPAAPYLPEKAVLWFQMGFSSFLRGGNPREGFLASQQAYLLSRDLGDIPLQISALACAIGSLACLGEFARAEELVQQAEMLLAKCPHAELHAIFLCHLSHYYWYKGDLEGMAEALLRAQEQIEKHGLTNLYPIVRFYDLSLKLNLGKIQEAAEIGSVLKHLTSIIGNRWFHGITLMLLGATNYYQGEFLKAKELLVSAREILSLPESRAEIHLTFIKIWLGLVAYHLQENGEAEKGLKEAVDHSRRVGSFIFLKEAFLALALLKWQQGNTKEAARHLRVGLSLARKHGHTLTIMVSREDLLKICTLALELGLEEVWEFVTLLLATARFADIIGLELDRLAKNPNPKIAGKVREIQLVIHRARALPLRIKTLGRFHILKGGVLLGNPERYHSQLLLKAIIAHGPAAIPADVLIEDLWPEAAPNVAEKNFKVGLHRLRKFLEPAMNRTFGSSYIHLRGNLISLDNELCEADADDFLNLAKQGEELERQGKAPEALALYHQALNLYGGDFLEEDVYLSWADRRRVKLRETYLDLLYRTAKLYEQRGFLTKAIDCYKMIICTDPVAEPAYQKLMLLYFQRGIRTAALRVYKECCKALRDGLGVQPDKVTTAIFLKIKDS